MDWRHLIVLVLVLLAGFWLGKKYPGTFSGIPVLNSVL